jgi:hypothetical protein
MTTDITADITVTVIMHREGALALPALASMRDMVERARGAGLAVEARAVLDRADEATRRFVALRGDWLDAVQEVSVGDLGLARNAGTLPARGRFLAFLDGDDLWGAEWLLRAHAAATAPDAPEEAIWHPEMLYMFAERDFEFHSVVDKPMTRATSHFFLHQASTCVSFDLNALCLDNVWSANAFAPRDLHVRHPYLAVDRSRGFGIEDWSWNLQTLWTGIPHLVVADTVHIIRVKDTGSLGQQNAAEGLLPHLPDGATPRLGRANPSTHRTTPA